VIMFLGDRWDIDVGFYGVDVFVGYAWEVFDVSELIPWGEFGFVLEVGVFYLGFLFLADFDAVFPEDFYAVVFWRVV